VGVSRDILIFGCGHVSFHSYAALKKVLPFSLFSSTHHCHSSGDCNLQSAGGTTCETLPFSVKIR